MRAVNTKQQRQCDPHSDTIVLPTDELALCRERKRRGQLSWSQVQRLIVADQLRRKATEGENDE